MKDVYQLLDSLIVVKDCVCNDAPYDVCAIYVSVVKLFGHTFHIILTTRP